MNKKRFHSILTDFDKRLFSGKLVKSMVENGFKIKLNSSSFKSTIILGKKICDVFIGPDFSSQHVKHVVVFFLSVILSELHPLTEGTFTRQKRLMETYFNSQFDPSIIKYRSPNSSQTIFKGYTYSNNSCCVDCVLMFLHIFCYNILPFNNSMLINQAKLERGETISSNNVREELLLRDGSLKQGGVWVFHNVASIYNTICEVYPKLCSEIPFLLKTEKKELISMSLPLLTMWEYLKDSSKKRILWTKIKSDILVFYNGGAPRIKVFNTMETESTHNIISSLRGEGMYNSVSKKSRCFGETILDDRYVCVYIIMLQGVTENSEGGSHYISYLKIGNKWWEYNDISPSFKEIGDLPNSVWREEYGVMPSMYFYSRI